ncbi:MAG: hydrogenase maturation protease [Rhodocyclales bacterium]|nr:hydrogenase maturation protease [Rhodocyclales bacterium]
MTAPTLIFGWGNPSRGDDALGPLFVEHFAELAARHPEWGAVDCLTDFQLQVEHALDLQGRHRVLFVDASLDAPAPFSLTRIEAARDASFTTHAMSPQAVLKVYADIDDGEPPPCWLLAIRGERFELGEGLSDPARNALQAALRCAAEWMETGPRAGIQFT